MRTNTILRANYFPPQKYGPASVYEDRGRRRRRSWQDVPSFCVYKQLFSRRICPHSVRQLPDLGGDRRKDHLTGPVGHGRTGGLRQDTSGLILRRAGISNLLLRRLPAEL